MRAQWRALAALLALACLGVLLQALDVFDWREVLRWARSHAQSWWLGPALVAAQVVLFMFALPGSSLVWLVAPLYAPPYASAILTLGGTLGGLAGYLFARRLTGGQLAQLRCRRPYLLLEKHADFPVLLALRLLPAFPHSVINYGAGTLHLPLPAFLGATVVGLGVKSFLYATVVHGAAQAEFSEFAHPGTVLALIVLVALALLGRALRRRV